MLKNFKENDIVTIKEGTVVQSWLKDGGREIEDETFLIKRIDEGYAYPYTITSTARNLVIDCVGQNEIQLATLVEQSTLDDFTWE